MMFSPLRLVRTAGLVATIMAATALTPAFAQDAAPAAPAAEAPAPVQPDTVVATVDGATITEADLSFAAEDLSQELQQMPPEQRKAFLLRVLIDMKVMAKAGADAGMADTPLFKQRLQYLQDRSLRRAYFADSIAKGVTPEAVKAQFGDDIRGDVTRYYLPGSAAVNLLADRALGGGGIASLRSDAQGKGFAQRLLSLPVTLPAGLIVNAGPGSETRK
mgnify:CR=1 FL=1